MISDYFLFHFSLMIHITWETSTYIIIIVHEYVTSKGEPILQSVEVATAIWESDVCICFSCYRLYKKRGVSIDHEVNPNSLN